MARKRGLGRGLDALLGASPPSGDGAQGTQGTRELPVDQVRRSPLQPRLHIDQDRLQELAESIRVQGIMQPIVVRRMDEDGHYELIAGERRWRAAQIVGLQTVPAVVREANDRTALALALVENIQREDLNPVEEAKALGQLVEQFELTHQEAADAVGRSRASVSNLLRLLDLEDEVRALLERGDLEMGHARALLALGADAQLSAARQVVRRGLSARQTEELVRRLKAGDGANRPGKAKRRDPDVARLESTLAERLGAPVEIRASARGKGAVVVKFANLDELDGILERIG